MVLLDTHVTFKLINIDLVISQYLFFEESLNMLINLFFPESGLVIEVPSHNISRGSSNSIVVLH